MGSIRIIIRWPRESLKRNGRASVGMLGIFRAVNMRHGTKFPPTHRCWLIFKCENADNLFAFCLSVCVSVCLLEERKNENKEKNICIYFYAVG